MNLEETTTAFLTAITTTPIPSRSMYEYLIPGLVLGFPALIIIAFFIVICCCRRKKKAKINQPVTVKTPLVQESNLDTVNSQASYCYYKPPATHLSQPKKPVEETMIVAEFVTKPIVENVPYKPRMLSRFTELDPAKIELLEQIGSGEFSQVYRAVLNRGDEEPPLIVAVKSATNGDQFADNWRALEKELDAMASIEQPHNFVITLLGAVTQSPVSFYIVTELCAGGILHDFLCQQGDLGIEIMDDVFTTPNTIEEAIQPRLTRGDLLVISSQIADGMKFLHERKCLHINLTSHHVLLSENRIPKIAGFGLYRQSQYPNDFKKIPPKPWQWTAPEVLTELNPYFHQGADVWSFGVLLWEIFTLGELPYGELTDDDPYAPEPADFTVQLMRDHRRLPQPHLTTDTIYAVMSSCWQLISFDRPSFSQLAIQLATLCTPAVPQQQSS